MQYLIRIAALLSCISAASADALTEFASLENMVNVISREIALSLSLPVVSNMTNSSMPAFTRPVGSPYVQSSELHHFDLIMLTVQNTAVALENITSTLAASTNNYNNNQTAFTNGNNETITDAAYFAYINLVPTLGQALQARGRAWHSEQNMPVYLMMQQLSQHVYIYGQGLTARSIISTASTIRTITASGNIVDAQDAWAAPGFLPGA